MNQQAGPSPSNGNGGINIDDAQDRVPPPAVQQFAAQLGMRIVQNNGQRQFGPRDWDPCPPSGTEVFVANVPRSVTELEIFPVFARVGYVYQIRLMLNFSGTNRGFCFVRFGDKVGAMRAVQMLNGCEILPGRQIGVVPSIDNCKLYIGNLPWDKTQEEVRDEISSVAAGVTKVVIVSSYTRAGTATKRFCFVSFTDHRTASIARRSFLQGHFKLWGHTYSAEWAAPKEESFYPPEYLNMYQ